MFLVAKVNIMVESYLSMCTCVCLCVCLSNTGMKFD